MVTPIRRPSGDSRGEEKSRAGAAIGCSFPARSTHVRRDELLCNLPGTYTRVPVAERLYWAAPNIDSLTPSSTGAGDPSSSSLLELNGTAIKVPFCM